MLLKGIACNTLKIHAHVQKSKDLALINWKCQGIECRVSLSSKLTDEKVKYTQQCKIPGK